nr:MAG TPA: hypothetical protein [Bacteriophage sp.]
MCPPECQLLTVPFFWAASTVDAVGAFSFYFPSVVHLLSMTLLYYVLRNCQYVLSNYFYI